ncbi:MAG: S8 family peptidase [Flavobacteriaceae bacterium]
MTLTKPKLMFGLSVTLLLMGCGGTTLVTTPVDNIDTIPLKVSDLSEAEKKSWGHADLATDTIPGMSVDKAYRDIIGHRKGSKVIVAVVDSGIDLAHEDLDGVLWTNRGERPGNGKDDDNNGYVDDVHGYNFLGESYNEQLEMARIIRLKLGGAAEQARAKTDLDADYQKALQNKQQYEQIKQAVVNADAAVKKHLGKSDYTKKEVAAIEPKDETMAQHKNVMMQMFSYEDDVSKIFKELDEGIKYFSDQLNYNLNVDFDGRKEVGDNPYDINSRNYGNGNPKNRYEDESHGTHVAGIIAAERNNGKGINGVANNVQIMSLRTVPNGDEYDKDVALAIRYAVDNGAKIINGSFGKSFSPNADWVYDAIKYAASKDVLFVHAAGNDGANLDDPSNPNFPNDQVNNGPEIADNVITVGALAPKYGSNMIATFSNYGKINVDVFAPGDDIYSTMPGNKYEFQGGTSMAAPAVAGLAALIRSQYPKLTASQVKKIIMQSGTPVKATVILGGNPSETGTLGDISKSGRIANAYSALKLAQGLANGKVTLN